MGKLRQAIYIISTDRGVVKIGISHNPVERLTNLQTASPFPLRLVYAAVHSDAARLEAVVHHNLRSRRAYGEWFSVTEPVARDAIAKAAAQIGKPIKGTGYKAKRPSQSSGRPTWFRYVMIILVLWFILATVLSVIKV